MALLKNTPGRVWTLSLGKLRPNYKAVSAPIRLLNHQVASLQIIGCQGFAISHWECDVSNQYMLSVTKIVMFAIITYKLCYQSLRMWQVSRDTRQLECDQQWHEQKYQNVSGLYYIVDFHQYKFCDEIVYSPSPIPHALLFPFHVTLSFMPNILGPNCHKSWLLEWYMCTLSYNVTHSVEKFNICKQGLQM